MMEYAGKDATKAFNGAGHSADALKDIKNFEIGELLLSKVDISVQNSHKVHEMDASAKQKKRIKLFFCFQKEKRKHLINTERFIRVKLYIQNRFK